MHIDPITHYTVRDDADSASAAKSLAVGVVCYCYGNPDLVLSMDVPLNRRVDIALDLLASDNGAAIAGKGGAQVAAAVLGWFPKTPGV